MTYHPFARAIVEDDQEAALATIADDVVFRSPAVLQAVPRQGKGRRDSPPRRDGVRELPLHERVARRRTTILFFEANVGDRELQGVDILEENEEGRIGRFTVMIRPLSGLQAVAAAMPTRLGLA